MNHQSLAILPGFTSVIFIIPPKNLKNVYSPEFLYIFISERLEIILQNLVYRTRVYLVSLFMNIL